MTCGIYEIKNRVTGECYIGQSVNIETRWNAHKNINFDTSQNMLPLMQLNKQNPDAVKWSIIQEIHEELYSEDELKFVLSVYEKFELDHRGGIGSEKILNAQPISIPAVPPSILNDSKLPDFVETDVVLESIQKWYEKQQRENCFLKSDVEYYEKRYYGTLARVRELVEEVEKLKKNPSISYKESMVSDYELYKLKKEVKELQDENEELTQRVSFWKEKCQYWRELCSER